MSVSEKLRAITASIAAAHDAMEEETKDAKKRFFAFVDAHNIPAGYAEYPWVPGQPASILEDVDRFYLCTGYNNPNGIAFGHDVYDGTETVLIPYAYFDDADAWEANLLARIAADREIVENTLRTFSEADEYTIASIRLDGVYGSQESLSVEVSPAVRDDNFYGINPFLSIDPKTGDITYASGDIAPVLLAKGVQVN